MEEIKSPSEAHQVNVALRLLRAEAIKNFLLVRSVNDEKWLATKSFLSLSASLSAFTFGLTIKKFLPFVVIKCFVT